MHNMDNNHNDMETKKSTSPCPNNNTQQLLPTTNTVLKILYEASQDNQSANMVWHLMADIIMIKCTKRIKWWIETSTKQIQHHNAAVEQWAQLGIQDTWMFFPWKVAPPATQQTDKIYFGLLKRATPCKSASLCCHPTVTLVKIC